MPQRLTEAKREIATSETALQECELVERDIERLRVTYEQYFLGVERRPPAELHRELKRRVHKLRGSFIRQTAVKFRVETLNSRFLTYERLWNRSLQEIENGTYRRDLFKARIHSQRRPDKPADTPLGASPEAATDPAQEPVTGSTPAAKPTARPPPRPADALSDPSLRALYDAYVTAKRRCNEDTSKLSFESMAQTLRKQAPALLKQHNAKALEFKVVIKDGKAVLRAVPK